jgi:uncharacterized protein YcaQ
MIVVTGDVPRMTTLKLTIDEARWIAVIVQGLDRRPFARRPQKADLMAAIDRLGCIQLDTISVISRSHETVLWSRLGPYDTGLISQLYDPDQLITEYWAHAAAIIPTSVLPLFRAAMLAYRESSRWPAGPKDREVHDRVLERIRTQGPISSRDIEVQEGTARASAWDWYGNKPEREALSTLWTRGELVIRKRESSFARFYDLPERIVPDLWTTDLLSDEYRQRAFLCRAIRALGIFTADWASDYFRSGNRIHLSVREAKDLLVKFEKEGKIVPVEVPGIREAIWIDAERRETLDLLREGKGRPTLTTLLSPFDNLVWNRRRDEALWGFAYRLECYTPAHKRIYGYYTLPILHRGRLVGRLEPSFDRRAKVLTVKSLYLEPGERVTPPLVRAITRAIEDLVRFLGGSPGAWRLLQANPAQILSMIQ